MLLPELICSGPCAFELARLIRQKPWTDAADVIAASMLCLPLKGMHARGQTVIRPNLCPSKGIWAIPG